MLSAVMLVSCGQADSTGEPPAAPSERVDRRACSDPAIVARLRDLIVEQARRLKSSEAAKIERIGREARLTIGGATVAERDSALDLTICRAQLRFALPEGARDAFDGGRQLAAELRYTVQRTRAGALTVQRLEGAEPLTFRLAAVPLRPSAQRPQVAVMADPTPDARTIDRPQRRTVAPPAAPLTARGALPEPALTSRGRPSFDCRRAGSRVERMICRDERLAALDRVTMSLYARRLSRADRSTRALLRQTQERFIERRDDCRRSGCVADRYRDRLDEIDALAAR